MKARRIVSRLNRNVAWMAASVLVLGACKIMTNGANAARRRFTENRRGKSEPNRSARLTRPRSANYAILAHCLSSNVRRIMGNAVA